MIEPAGALERSTGVTLWRQLEARLAQEIAAMAPESRLPTEAELARRFAVNRHTVRQAVRALVGRGLIRVEHGKGAYVRDLLDYRLGPRTRFTANLLAAERLPSRRLLAIAEVEADAALAQAIGLTVGSALLRVHSVGEADGVPVVVGTRFLALDRLAQARARLAALPSFTALYAAHGHADYRRGPTTVTARPPTAEEAMHLRMPTGLPVLVTDSSDRTPNGIVLGVGSSAWASERMQLVIDP